MNIEEIKKRVDQRNEHYVFESEHEVQYHEDIQYILSIIEQAEKALQQFTRGNFYLAIENNAWSNYRHTEDAPWKIAEEALQAIRKGD